MCVQLMQAVNHAMHSKPLMDYCNKLILAPMVRGSRLPMRMLALRYGAHLVYTEEHIDVSVLTTKRKFNDVLGTFDYVNEANGYLVFRTSPLEKSRLVFQMGTADADRAVKLAKMVENDVSAIDVNMGCPQPYSTRFGMGAALMSKPENAKAILKNLVENVKLPITCKIRVFDSVEETVKLAKEFEALGVSAIAVHGRTRKQKHHDPVSSDAIRAVAESLSIPVIANGGSTHMETREDILKFKEGCGTSSVMVARAAQLNISIFREEGPLPIEVVLPEYLKTCVDFDNSAPNTKYSILKMFESIKKFNKTVYGPRFEEAFTLEEICDLWDLGDYAREKYSEYSAKGLISLPCSPLTNFNMMSTDVLEIRKQMFNDQDIIFHHIKFRRNYHTIDKLPKTILNAFAGRNKLPLPVYETRREDRLYYSVATFLGKKYATLVWDRQPKHSEQGAALACLLHLNLVDEEFLIAIKSLYK